MRRELVAGVAGTTTSQGRVPVQWARGDYAQFDPTLTVYKPDGTVAGLEGDDLAKAEPLHGQSVCITGWGNDTNLRILIVPLKPAAP